jgi:peptide/nickel transport system permease protein
MAAAAPILRDPRLLPLIALVLVAMIGPAVIAADPLATDVAGALSPPTRAHPFGTDHLGRDMLARVAAAARLDLLLAFAAVALSALVGTAAGLAIGFAGGRARQIAAGGSDALAAFPLYLVAMVFALASGGGAGVVIAATAIVNLPFYIRLAIPVAAEARAAPVVLAARMGGAGRGRILRTLVLPEVAPLVAVQGSVNLGWTILNAAGLSFLGLGIDPPAPEWGIMLAEGAPVAMAGAWWVAVFPGLAIVGAALAFQAAGEALRRALARPGP